MGIFNNISQALSSVTSWFSGTHYEMLSLQRNLVLLHDKIPPHRSRGITVASKEQSFGDASQAKLFSEDEFFDVRECPPDNKDVLNAENLVKDSTNGKRGRNNLIDNNVESTEYGDSFLLLEENNRDLPFELQQIITSDLNLLTLTEAGLPS